NRAVRERTLVHALQDAYRNVIPYKRYPVAVLSVELPAADVDVNVHPSKLEVRVRNERIVFATLRGAVKQALTAKSEASIAVGVGRGVADEASEIAASSSGAWEPATQAAMFSGTDARIRDAFSDYLVRRDEKRADPAAAQVSTWPPTTITAPGADPVKREDTT